MKIQTLCILFAAICFTSCGVTDEKDDIQSYLDETVRLYQERNEDTVAIAEILTVGLSKYPDNMPLLQSRANLYCSRGMLQECRTDTEHLLELKPNLIEAHMMLCMLDEFEGVEEKTYSACYRNVVHLHAIQPQPSSPDKEISGAFTYVFALLMANAPDAEKEKAAFLSRANSEPQAWIYQDILNDFSRERALREVFGK